MKKLKSLLLDAELWREDYKDVMDEINGKCDVCKRYAKTPHVQLLFAYCIRVQWEGGDGFKTVERKMNSTHYRHVVLVYYFCHYK